MHAIEGHGPLYWDYLQRNSKSSGQLLYLGFVNKKPQVIQEYRLSSSYHQEKPVWEMLLYIWSVTQSRQQSGDSASIHNRRSQTWKLWKGSLNVPRPRITRNCWRNSPSAGSWGRRRWRPLPWWRSRRRTTPGPSGPQPASRQSSSNSRLSIKSINHYRIIQIIVGGKIFWDYSRWSRSWVSVNNWRREIGHQAEGPEGRPEEYHSK